jgi:hypothetical protein
MPRDYIPASDAQFNLWLHNFASQLNSSGTALGFSAPELTSLDAAVNLWDTQFAARLTARDAARSATAMKRDARRAAVELVRPFARRVQSHPTTDDGVRALMGLTPLEQPPTGGEGAGPADETPLLALDFGTRGRITVHFGPNPANENRNGLPRGAIGAVLQVRAGGIDGAGGWQWLDNPSSSPHVHVVQPSEATVLAYRCAYLYRRGQKGPWSAPAEAAVTP